MSESCGWRIHAGRDRYMACWAMCVAWGYHPSLPRQRHNYGVGIPP